MTVAEFVAQVRARRAAAGRPERLANEAVYRLLDGILAARRQGGVPGAGAA